MTNTTMKKFKFNYLSLVFYIFGIISIYLFYVSIDIVCFDLYNFNTSLVNSIFILEGLSKAGANYQKGDMISVILLPHGLLFMATMFLIYKEFLFVKEFENMIKSKYKTIFRIVLIISIAMGIMASAVATYHYFTLIKDDLLAGIIAMPIAMVFFFVIAIYNYGFVLLAVIILYFIIKKSKKINKILENDTWRPPGE